MHLVPKVLLAAVILVFQISAQEEITYEHYKTELAALEQRGLNAREKIAQEQAAIEKLKKDLKETGQRITSVTQQIYTVLGITEKDLISAENELGSIHKSLQLLSELSPPEISKDEIVHLETTLEPWKSNRITSLERISKRITVIEELLGRVKNTVQSYIPPQAAETVVEVKKEEKAVSTVSPLSQSGDSYTVKQNPGKPETLFQIAREIYGDPLEWPRIYRANKAQIDANYQKCKAELNSPKVSEPQDFIIPGQVLQIPR